VTANLVIGPVIYCFEVVDIGSIRITVSGRSITMDCPVFASPVALIFVPASDVCASAVVHVSGPCAVAAACIGASRCAGFVEVHLCYAAVAGIAALAIAPGVIGEHIFCFHHSGGHHVLAAAGVSQSRFVSAEAGIYVTAAADAAWAAN
jgi:hypothetical protein